MLLRNKIREWLGVNDLQVQTADRYWGLLKASAQIEDDMKHVLKRLLVLERLRDEILMERSAISQKLRTLEQLKASVKQTSRKRRTRQ